MRNSASRNSQLPTTNSQRGIWDLGFGSWEFRAERGLSLVEATLILMVMALLTAVIAPAVGGYLVDARESAAKSDVEEIASALTRMLTDTGEAWFLRDGNGAATPGPEPPVRTSGQRVDMLVSNGTIPQLQATARAGGLTDWDDAANNAAIQ